MAPTTLARTLAALALVGLGAVGCGEATSDLASDEPTSAGSSTEPSPTESPEEATTPGTPQCTDVWIDGATLPKPYRGCYEGSVKVAKDSRYCEFLKPLVTHADHFYAVAGGQITETADLLKKDAGYRKALRACTA